MNPHAGHNPNPSQQPLTLPFISRNSNNNSNNNSNLQFPPQINMNAYSNPMFQQLLQQTMHTTPQNNHMYTANNSTITAQNTQNYAAQNTTTTTQNSRTYGANVPPGYYQFGDGNSMTLMADMVSHLNNSDAEIYRLLSDKFSIYGSHLLVVTVKQYRSVNENAQIIKIPSKAPINNNNQDEIDIIHHTRKGSVPDSIKKQRKESLKEEKKDDIVQHRSTLIADSGLTEERYKEILGLIVDYQSVDHLKLGIEKDEAIKIQNNLFCNGLVTLGKEYKY
eukprot:80798_1